jgi:hypothetical protein
MYPPRSRETDYAYANCLVRATDLLSGKVDLSGYPLRYLSIGEYSAAGGRHAVFTAVEWLEQNGWEVVNGYWEEHFDFSVLVRRALGAG